MFVSSSWHQHSQHWVVGGEHGGCVLILLFLFVVTWQRQSFRDSRGRRSFFFSFFLPCTTPPSATNSDFFPGETEWEGRIGGVEACSFKAHKPEYLAWGLLSREETFLKAAPEIVSSCHSGFCSCFRWDFSGKKLKRKNEKRSKLQPHKALSPRPV